MSWFTDTFQSKTYRGEEPVSFGVPMAISGAWGALSTTGKVLVGAGAGAAGYAAYDWLFGGTKKEQALAAAPQNLYQQPIVAPVVAPVVVQPNITTTNTDNRTFDYSNNQIWNSPGAVIKKQIAPATSVSSIPSWSTPTTAPTTAPTSGTQGQDLAATQGMDWATIAAIAGVALVAYGYTSRKGK